MKINDIGRLGAVNSYQRQTDNIRQIEDKKNKRKDEVSISSEALEMLKASDTTAASTNAKRIQELKEQTQSGTYRVDAEKLAKKLAPYFTDYIK
ncbi:flagellar biosynthesis anti-sigma factor FlgM [Paenibacillus yonginensis]|uniref:Negative regulator of flagellin synthesis n=1 Tax=Paenibacillus yonginensis TaxID=1462996 RepID=A0A1B1N7A2_9BACL|nr:flagellar biosynthesis anti-sigma factor FlgM [Paenibacillus yonginensis]ANS77297.1 flagellar biosynthesis anti-sigma factor FlgM [Paenibacillus yonginensis]